MDKIIVLDFGGQYCHLISRRIRDLGVFSEVLPARTTASELEKISGLKGIIFSGGGLSVFDKTSPKGHQNILELGVPILGICYGHQVIAHLSGGIVTAGQAGEYGITKLKIKKRVSVLSSLKSTEPVWMNHRDVVTKLASGYQTLASTNHCQIAAFGNVAKNIYGLQFHPEVTHTPHGQEILRNFALKICRAKKGWGVENVLTDLTQEIKQQIGTSRAVIGLSGGVDSSTAAILVNQAIGKRLTAVYVDTGLMRYRETEFIEQVFKKYRLNLKIIRAGDQFFKALKGVTDPEKKRKIIGRTFIEVFDRVAEKEKAKVLIQGTIYSDRIESGITQYASTIKSHHNVGGLPKNMKLRVYEPLRDFYKDEVRNIAKKLGLPESIARRHVFPGPGLGIRIVGEVTPERAEIVRQASHIVEEEIAKAGLYNRVWMAFAVLLPIRNVGVEGDARSYKFPVVVRIVESKDAMTANFAKISYKILETISTRITNEIKAVNRVVYDISNKPPATMEWE
ncbi:MAG: glutamine-hydrolyzing GMP synthase [Patescibacteria group bacterium]